MTKLISNDHPGSTGRLTRLNRVLTAAQSFVCHCEGPVDQATRLGRFNASLLQLEDTLGVLSAEWASPADRDEFAPVIELAWRYQLETAPVQHTTSINI